MISEGMMLLFRNNGNCFSLLTESDGSVLRRHEDVEPTVELLRGAVFADVADSVDFYHAAKREPPRYRDSQADSRVVCARVIPCYWLSCGDVCCYDGG